MSIKSFEKLFMLAAVVILLVSSAFSSVGTAHAEGMMFEKGTSNVSQKEFNQIRNSLKATEEYQAYKEHSKINAISKENIVINTVGGPRGDIAYVEFVFGKFAKQSDNLAYAQFTFDVENTDVISDQAIYAERLDNEDIHINVLYNLEGHQTEIYNITVDNEGTIFDENGLVVNADDFIVNAEKNIKNAGDIVRGNGENANTDEFSTFGFCEYAVGALCGTGGGVACYALAGALGITTGVGGVSLAAVCALVGSVGCTAATNQICG